MPPVRCVNEVSATRRENSVKLVMDFAGAPVDAEITVSDIVLIVK